MELGSRARKKKKSARTLGGRGGAQSIHKIVFQVWLTSNNQIPTHTIHHSAWNPNFRFLATFVLVAIGEISAVSKSDELSERRSGNLTPKIEQKKEYGHRKVLFVPSFLFCRCPGETLASVSCPLLSLTVSCHLCTTLFSSTTCAQNFFHEG